MLRQSLRTLGADPLPLLAAAGIEPTARAEEIPVEGFVALARAPGIPEAGPFRMIMRGRCHDKLRRLSLTAYQAPLCETIVDCPEPKGSEVLVRIERCGVCHSDLHMQDGYFALGDGKSLDVRDGRTLPFTLGHEIAGVVERAGPRRRRMPSPARRSRSIPGSAAAHARPAQAGEENLCSNNRHLGISADGGFASHVLVPHPRYLIDYAPLSPSFAGALMCSGLTAYSALKRLQSHAARGRRCWSASAASA